MPHDSAGRKIEVGDVIKTVGCNQKGAKVVGHVIEMTESQSCSGRVVFNSKHQGLQSDYFNASDAVIVLKADGSEPGEA